MKKSIKKIFREKKIAEMYRKMHEESMLDDVYRAGYESDKEDENPYEFDKVVGVERMRIAVVPGPLTEEQKARLSELNELFEKDPWNRWSRGHHARWEMDLVWA